MYGNTGGAGAFQANPTRDQRPPTIFKNNLAHTTHFERDNIDQVLDVLQGFYEEEKLRMKAQADERDQKQ